MPYYRNKDGSYTQVPKGPDSVYVEETTTRAKRGDVAAADVRTPTAVNSPLRAQSIAAYRAAGEVFTDPNRTVEDVQRAVAERVQRGREVRGATDYELYREGLRRPNIEPPNVELPPNIAPPLGRQAAGLRPPQVNPPITVSTLPREKKNFADEFNKGILSASRAGAPNPFASDYVQNRYINPIRSSLAAARAPKPEIPNRAPAPFETLGNQLNPSLAERPVPTYLLGNVESAPMPGSNRLQRDGVRVLSERLANEPVTREQLTRGIYEVGPNSFTDDRNAQGARPYSGSGGTLNVVSDEQFRNAGLRGRSPVTEADRARYDAQVAAAQEVNRRSALRTRQLAGAAEGGDTLRQITKVQERADRAYQKAINRGLNSKAAARARDGILEQAGQLIDYNRDILRNQADIYNTDAYRERTAADQDYRQQMLGLEAATLQATSQKASDAYFDEWLTNYTSFPDEDGKYQPNPVAKARIQDMLGSYSGPGRTRIARAMVGLDSALQELSARTNRDFADWSEVIDMSPDGSMTIDAGRWTDLINTPGYTLNDFISELLPFGASGDILEGIKNGKRVRIPRSILEETALNPRAHRYIYGDQDLRNR